jgi:hypothetical protein
MHEQINISEAVEGFRKGDHKEYMDFFESKSTINKVRSVTEDDMYAFGAQLEQWESYKSFMEANGSASDLGTLPNIALDVIASSQTQSILPLIAGTQIMNEEKGTIWFKQVIASTSRGNVTAGQNLLNPLSGRQSINSGFANNQILNEDSGATGDGIVTTFAISASYGPVLERSVNILAGTVLGIDDGLGNIVGVGISGTVDYTTGAISVSFAVAPAAAVKLLTTYTTASELQDEIATIRSEFTSKTVQAFPMALRSDMGLFKAYSMGKRFNMDPSTQMAKDLTTELSSEISGAAIMKAYFAAVGNTNWDKTGNVALGISYTEHKLTFNDSLADAESVILGNAGRTTGSMVYVCGTKASATLRTLPGFTKMNTQNATMGAHLYGSYDGVPVIRAINIPDNEMLIISRGTSSFDSAIIFGSWMPLTIVDVKGDHRNPLKNSKGIASMNALDVVQANLITKITILNA